MMVRTVTVRRGRRRIMTQPVIGTMIPAGVDYYSRTRGRNNHSVTVTMIVDGTAAQKQGNR